MEAVAKLKNLKGSPRKARLVVDMIRGMEVDKALSSLKFTAKNSARPVEKLLLSAIKNWENANPTDRLEDQDLVVKKAFVDMGKTLKRFRPAPFGRPHRIRRRTNHITIIVDKKDSDA